MIKKRETGNSQRENIFAGVAGALLFSTVGGGMWYLLYRVGFLAGISGLVGVFAAVYGYRLFAGNQSVRGVVISVTAAVIMLIAAWYLCLTTDVYNVYKNGFASGDLDMELTFVQALSISYTYLEDKDIAFSYLKDLGLGLVLCAWASFSAVKNILEAAKQPETAPENTEE